MENSIKELIAIGASVTANCQPCLNYHVSKAKEAGVDENDIALAIEVARSVREGAAAKMDDFASGIAGVVSHAECGAGKSCNC
jgi:AhpD family alkylhydroperoxidase